ncbi:MAG: hypothetical protein JSW11_03545 [Candidatus Heimdallarchaeota archaeon]|nr:MAG: hypothetical protein JSW11_03545 [Candidatus Heimdallarchaeota archaeon]
MAEKEEPQEEAIPITETERKITVDLWKTKIHGEIVGIKQKEEHMAKSRQFTRDLELFGEVIEKKKGKDETVGYVGYRKGLWDDEKDKLERRLVIKLFSKSMYYQGTLEEMVGREFTRSLSARHDFPSFNLMIADYEYLIPLNKIRGGWFVPEWFVFRYDDEDGFIPIILKHKMGLGIDYRIVNGIGDIQFGKIDGKKFDVGGRYDITLKASDERLVDNVLVRALILFASSLKFHEDIIKKIKKGTKKMRKNEWQPDLSNEEKLLRRNPRAILRK